MSNVVDFVTGWVQENVNATFYDDDSEAKSLARKLVLDARQAGISKAQLLAELGDLEEHLLSVLNERADEEVDRLAQKDK